eukprot:CAMPEP_0198536758 /NCGR_PEP_ID=MMETSP1462-20131121/43346_1 /TAXON_ID=1333877 /ORGANISM="Brandtodinium nutriculum, Strain RCC3387" /LENGTH=176 /DNA_ID=CAMNT_0044266721 /DNA_START=203 /DNA_END=731 /DNA_ORIENTATION=+
MQQGRLNNRCRWCCLPARRASQSFIPFPEPPLVDAIRVETVPALRQLPAQLPLARGFEADHATVPSSLQRLRRVRALDAGLRVELPRRRLPSPRPDVQRELELQRDVERQNDRGEMHVAMEGQHHGGRERHHAGRKQHPPDDTPRLDAKPCAVAVKGAMAAARGRPGADHAWSPPL